MLRGLWSVRGHPSDRLVARELGVVGLPGPAGLGRVRLSAARSELLAPPGAGAPASLTAQAAGAHRLCLLRSADAASDPARLRTVSGVLAVAIPTTTAAGSPISKKGCAVGVNNKRSVIVTVTAVQRAQGCTRTSSTSNFTTNREETARTGQEKVLTKQNL